jgi:catechol 2,3-dioxygenase-like lactoylglutathione lyase family enzyme
MTRSLITHLRHVDLAVPDFERQLAFYTRTWGLTAVASDRGIAFLAAEGSPERYILRLRKDPAKRLDLVSFGVASAADVDALADQLIRKGVTLAAEPASLGTEGGGYGLRFFDVDGRTVEVSADVATRAHRKVEEQEPIPVRLSHVVLNSTDPDATARWYSDTLGFRLSDTLAGAELGTVMNFMRCNPRHHSLAFARGPHVSLHHVSFELRGLDEFMRGTGRVLRSGTRMVWGPGRHLAGSNTFAYFLDPQNNTIEYTTELAELDEDTWHPHIYDMHDEQVQDQWGTANPMNELVAKESFNDPDPGLFTAPPV